MPPPPSLVVCPPYHLPLCGLSAWSHLHRVTVTGVACGDWGGVSLGGRSPRVGRGAGRGPGGLGEGGKGGDWGGPNGWKVPGRVSKIRGGGLKGGDARMGGGEILGGVGLHYLPPPGQCSGSSAGVGCTPGRSLAPVSGRGGGPEEPGDAAPPSQHPLLDPPGTQAPSPAPRCRRSPPGCPPAPGCLPLPTWVWSPPPAAGPRHHPFQVGQQRAPVPGGGPGGEGATDRGGDMGGHQGAGAQRGRYCGGGDSGGGGYGDTLGGGTSGRGRHGCGV